MRTIWKLKFESGFIKTSRWRDKKMQGVKIQPKIINQFLKLFVCKVTCVFLDFFRFKISLYRSTKLNLENIMSQNIFWGFSFFAFTT